jgi:prepilin-type N-terminal cleavage/methylation domain-containing protein
MSAKSRSQHGFTLIELVVVIAILAILAAVALPKFADLTSEARTASLAGVRGGFTAAVQIVHAKWLAGGTGVAGAVSLEGGVTVQVNATGWPTVDTANAAQDTASELYGLLMSGALPTGWTSAEAAAAGAGTATFTLPGTGGGSFTYNGATGGVS